MKYNVRLNTQGHPCGADRVTCEGIEANSSDEAIIAACTAYNVLDNAVLWVRNAAEIHLVKYLLGKGVKLTPGDVKDFNLFGDESLEEIEGYADDLLSDIDSDEAEYRAELKANQYDSPALDMDLQY